MNATYAGNSEAPRRRFDAGVLLTVYLILLVGVPAPLIFKPLGASGTPANILGIVCFIWWGTSRLVRRGDKPRGNPARVALLVFWLAVLPSLAAMYLRSAPGVETSAANRTILIFIGAAGITLAIIDGLDSRERLETLLKRFVVAATALSCTGLLQAVTGIELAAKIRIPGLYFQFNAEIGQIAARGHFTRVQGTSTYPIEFGVVLAMAFPVALHYAMTAEPGRRMRPATCAALIAIGIPLSLSRSGIVGLCVAFVVMCAGWSGRQRINAIVAAVLFVGLTRAAVPGLVGTVLHLFTGISGDSSAEARTSRYAALGHYFQQTPIFGRGFGTFIPQNYIFVDNQYLQTAVEMGAVGVAALLVLLMTGVFLGRGARRRAVDPVTANLGQALAASMLASVVSFYTYDALSFPVATGTTFFLLGAAGALWRFAPERPVLASAPLFEAVRAPRSARQLVHV